MGDARKLYEHKLSLTLVARATELRHAAGAENFIARNAQV